MPTALKSQTMPTEQRRAVIYLRVSTTAQAEKDADPEGYSLPAQREACVRKVKELGGVVVAEFIDRGESAKTALRPEFQRMLAEIRDIHEADMLVVSKLDRWARNREDDVMVGIALKRMRVQLVSASENIDDTPTGKLLRGLFASINEWYSDNLAGEAIKGMTQKAKMGGTPGRAKVGYLNVRDRVDGYEVRTIAVDEDRAPHVIWAFQTYATGEISIRDLTRQLERRGLRTAVVGKTGGKAMTASHVHRMLMEPYYVGTVRFRGVEYEGRHQPLISRELFDRVQGLLASRVTAGDRSSRHNHYLKGSLYCGRCGGKMGYSINKGNGGTYEYFFCWRRHRTGECDQSYFAADVVEEGVRQYHRTIRPDPSCIPELSGLLKETLAAQQAAQISEAKKQSKRLVEIDRRREKLIDAFYADALDTDQLKIQQQRLATERAIALDILAACDVELEHAHDVLIQLLDLVTHGADLYDRSNSTGRRLLNQFFFRKLFIEDAGVAGAEDTDVIGLVRRAALGATNRAAERGTRNTRNPATFPAVGFHLELLGGR